MFVRNIICLMILAISPYQAYSMDNPLKRKAEESLDLAISTKGMRIESPESKLLFAAIQKGIYNFDANNISQLICTEHAAQLTNEQKNALHQEAKIQKNGIKIIVDAGGGIASKTDDEAIKNKFSYDGYYENIQKISRNLSALKTLPSLIFPQAIFTPAPLCAYNTHIQKSDQRIKPDQCLIALIKNEQTAIRLCCYHITLENIAKALIKKAKENITVEIITHREQGRKEADNNAINTLVSNGIAVLSPQKAYEQMHHKFCIFTNNIGTKSILWTGSYNLTSYSNSHSWDDANILDNPNMVKQYNDRFAEIKANSSPYSVPTAKSSQNNNSPAKPVKPITNNNALSDADRNFLENINPDQYQ
jgi:hypothetical protein